LADNRSRFVDRRLFRCRRLLVRFQLAPRHERPLERLADDAERVSLDDFAHGVLTRERQRDFQHRVREIGVAVRRMRPDPSVAVLPVIAVKERAVRRDRIGVRARRRERRLARRHVHGVRAPLRGVDALIFERVGERPLDVVKAPVFERRRRQRRRGRPLAEQARLARQTHVVPESAERARRCFARARQQSRARRCSRPYWRCHRVRSPMIGGAVRLSQQ
jgi:hypothetical protein